MSDEALEQMAVDGRQMVEERREYAASRTSEQSEAFRRVLEHTMDLWYSHASTTVVLLTELPDVLPAAFDSSRTYERSLHVQTCPDALWVHIVTTSLHGECCRYENRGWTTFERCSAELAKNFKLTKAKWKLVIDTALVERAKDQKGGAQRRLPTTPERMEVLLESRQFTNGADKAQVRSTPMPPAP